jgi:caffeoyl-CoA O-methyltransferase
VLTLVPKEIEEYAEAHSEKPLPLFDALARETREKMQDPQMQVGPLEGAFLRLLVRLVRARRVLEIGMFTGYSALMMAEGLPDDGELVTCDVDPEAESIARRYFAQSPHGKKIHVRMGSALQTLQTLAGPFDLVFIDADKENLVAYFERALPLLPSGGLIAVDNTLWSGRVLEPKAKSDHAVASFNEHVARDTRVEKVVLTLRDGVTLAWKR